MTSSPSAREESGRPNSPLTPTIISCFSGSISNVRINAVTSAQSGTSISKGSGRLRWYTLKSLYSFTVILKLSRLPVFPILTAPPIVRCS